MSNTLLQPVAFLAMLYCGVWIGLVYDALRFIRRVIKARIVHALCDGIFVLVSFCIIAAGFLTATGGTIRLYLCAAIAIGMLLQQWSIGYLIFHAFYSLRTRMQ